MSVLARRGAQQSCRFECPRHGSPGRRIVYRAAIGPVQCSPRGSVRKRATVLEGPRTCSGQKFPDPVLPGPEASSSRSSAPPSADRTRTFTTRSDRVGIRLGHEPSALDEVGPHVRSLRTGDRAGSGVIGCGVSYGLLAGQPDVCLDDKDAAFGTVPDLPAVRPRPWRFRSPTFSPPHSRGNRRRGGRPADRHLPMGYLGALGAASSRAPQWSSSASAPWGSWTPVRLASRAGAPPGRRRRARAPGPGRAPGRGAHRRRSHRVRLLWRPRAEGCRERRSRPSEPMPPSSTPCPARPRAAPFRSSAST